MCVVSMVIDDRHRRWPRPADIPEIDIKPFVEELRKAQRRDAEEGNEDCAADDKREYLRGVRDRALELAIQSGREDLVEAAREFEKYLEHG